MEIMRQQSLLRSDVGHRVGKLFDNIYSHFEKKNSLSVLSSPIQLMVARKIWPKRSRRRIEKSMKILGHREPFLEY